VAIKTFKDKGLEKLYLTGKSVKINAQIKDRLLNKLDYLEAATEMKDLAFPPSNRLHPLKGKLKGYYAIAVNGPWRIIFQFKNGHAYNVHFVNYH